VSVLALGSAILGSSPDRYVMGRAVAGSEGHPRDREFLDVIHRRHGSAPRRSSCASASSIEVKAHPCSLPFPSQRVALVIVEFRALNYIMPRTPVMAPPCDVSAPPCRGTCFVM
jgi:hypothetical protein